MKKTTSFILAILLLFTFSACTKTTEENPTEHESIQATTTDPSKVYGTIYGVFSNDESKIISTEIICNGGIITTERIAAGLSGWTGLKFRISVEKDDANKKITVNWLPESSLAEGSMPTTQQDEFVFSDETQVRVFMLNSLCFSITKNLGDYDVFFTLNGENISTLGLDGITSDTAFNKTESEYVYVK